MENAERTYPDVPKQYWSELNELSEELAEASKDVVRSNERYQRAILARIALMSQIRRT